MRLYKIILLILLIPSCKSAKYVEVPITTHDTTYIERFERDSIYKRDSIYIDRVGDTIYKTIDRYIYRDRHIRDTSYVCKIDTVTVVEKVEKELTKYQNFCLFSGEWLWIIILLLLFSYISYRLIKSKFGS